MMHLSLGEGENSLTLCASKSICGFRILLCVDVADNPFFWTIFAKNANLNVTFVLQNDYSIYNGAVLIFFFISFSQNVYFSKRMKCLKFETCNSKIKTKFVTNRIVFVSCTLDYTSRHASNQIINTVLR
jgi:hypothetical protein